MDTIDRSALVPFTPEEMYTLVRDIDAYPLFLPWCHGAKVTSGNDDEAHARIDFSVTGVSRSFTTRNRYQRNKMIEMHLVDGPFNRLEGCWRFDPLGEEGSKISLFLKYDFSSRMLGMLVGPAFNQIANSLVEAFHKRAVEVYGER